MTISHGDHDHPNTPAARAACRKAMSAGRAPLSVLPVDECPGVPHRKHTSSDDPCPAVKPAQMTVVPRTRGDGGVVKGMKESRAFRNGQARMQDISKSLKRPNTILKKDYDLADVPRMLAYGVRMAWAADLEVKVGDRFNDEEKRLLIQHETAEISLVWRDRRPDGIWAIFVRNWDSSRTFKVESVQHAFEVSATREAWDEYGNLIDG